VPPEFFGRPWLKGEEPRWAEIDIPLPSGVVPICEAKRGQSRRGEDVRSQGDKLLLSAHVRGAVDDDTLVDGMIELYRALNKYHILCGGSGLTVDDWQIFVPAGAPEEVLL